MNEWTAPTCKGTGKPVRKILRAPGTGRGQGRGLCEVCSKEIAFSENGARKHVMPKKPKRKSKPGRKPNKRIRALKLINGGYDAKLRKVHTLGLLSEDLTG